jgi:hypothetical protein
MNLIEFVLGLIISLILISGLTAMIQDDAAAQEKSLGSSGFIAPGLEFYSDISLKEEFFVLDWGELSPGVTSEKTVYMLNSGGSKNLSLRSANWDPPEAEKFLNLSWNFENQLLKENNFVEIVFFLKVSPQIKDVEFFSFDISILY